jgi:hypothetical protein
MNGAHPVNRAVHGKSSVVINNFYGTRALLSPYETHAPLVIYSNAPLRLPVSRELFESVAWRGTQKLQRLRGIQLRQLAFGHGKDGTKALRALAFKQSLRISTGKPLNHDNGNFITPNVTRQA